MKNFLGNERNVLVVRDWSASLETPSGLIDVSEMWENFFRKARASSQLCSEFYGFLDGPFRDFVRITGVSDGKTIEFCPIRLDYASELNDMAEDAVILSSPNGSLYLLEGAYIKKSDFANQRE